MRHHYAKLVRDLVPRALEDEGVAYQVRSATPDEAAGLLLAKLREEVDEFAAARGRERQIEELADIYEVLLQIGSRIGVTGDQLEAERAHKEQRRGGFSRGIVLEWTEDPR